MELGFAVMSSMGKVAFVINKNAGIKTPQVNILDALKFLEERKFKVIYFDGQSIGSDIQNLIRENYTTIVACGGDGTVSSVAAALIDNGNAKKLKLGILPLGTFNHFAKDIGLPLGLEDALKVIHKGKTKEIDVGQVNKIYFLNNSSLGLYPKMVRHRENISQKGLARLLALPQAYLLALKYSELLKLSFQSDGREAWHMTSLVFVGNNEYEFNGLTFGSRKSLDKNILGVCIVKNKSKLELFALSVKAVMGTLREEEAEFFNLNEFYIDYPANYIDVAHDGEISREATPLHYKTVPKALRVIVP